MFVLSNLFQALAVVVNYAITFYWWLIIARAILSWVSPDPYNPIVQFIERATEPFLAPLRRLIPTWNLGIDLSPLIAMLILLFLQKFLVATLYGLAARF